MRRTHKLLPLFLILALLCSACEGVSSAAPDRTVSVSLSNLPDYDGEPYVVVNDNQPDFSPQDFTTNSFESYSPLDELGRCGPAYANIGVDLMPTEERGSIGQVKPSGWHTVKYDCVDGKYLYNRCHLIGYQLTAENANEENLITGTRYLNVEGMLPFENMVADYIKETENHVLYRVTPIFQDENLVASGVLMEAESVEDDGDGICFCVYVYNVQPGVVIDYATGESWLEEDAAEQPDATGSTVGGSEEETALPDTEESPAEEESPAPDMEENGRISDPVDPEDATKDSAAEETENQSDADAETHYVLNTNTGKFHLPTCSSVERISDANREDYTGSRQWLIDEGYEPCGICKP